MPPVRAGLLLVALSSLARLGLAVHWGALADEAYYWSWSRDPAWGWFDHPPLIGWLLAWAPPVAHWVRLPGWALTTVGSALLVQRAEDPVRLAALLAVLPPLWLFGTLATPDAPLIGLWMLALAATQRGWAAMAGACAVLAILAKYPGAALLPLLLLGDPTLARQRAFWLGALGASPLLVGHGAWSFAHGHPALAFQAAHGLGGDGLRWLGPLGVIATQVALSGGLLGLCALGWAARGPRDDRLAWATSVPLLAFFALAGLRGTPEANWPAAAWVGLALGLARTTGRLGHATRTGVWIALGLSVMAVLHVERPLLPLRIDAGARPHTGAAFARTAAKHVLPVGAAPHSEAAATAFVITERYQEAAWLRWHLGVPATVWAGCGRPSALDARPAPREGHFVRPATGGPPHCLEGLDVGHGARFTEHDPAGRPVGAWDVLPVGPGSNANAPRP